MVLKSQRTGAEKKFYEMALEITKEHGYVLYDLDYIGGSTTLKVFIMDPETNTAVIEDCVKVDHGFTPYMEELDWIPEDITLEVSSPGLYRTLNSVDHFKWAQGTPVMIQLSKTIGDLLPGEDLDKKFSKTKKVIGDLEEVSEQYIILKLDEEYSLKLQYTDIKRANLEPEIQAKSR